MGYYAPVPGSYRITGQFLGGFRSSGGHSGMDFAAPYGTLVRAVVPGRVIFSGWSGGYGNLVKVQHDDGTVGFYAHHSRNAVRPGMRVQRGMTLGYVGSTGNSTGPHSHFEVRRNGKPVDPRQWLNSDYRASSAGMSGNQRSTPGYYGGVRLSREQLQNAQTIVSVGRQMGANERDLVISLMTAFQESRLENLNYGDRDSLGLFQQRPSAGWGTRSQIMNPRYAAAKFFENLLRIRNRGGMRLTVAAQAVQRSAFPEAYARWEELARAVLGNPGAGVYPVGGYDTFHANQQTTWNNPWEVMAGLGPLDTIQTLPQQEGPFSSVMAGGPAESATAGPAASLEQQASLDMDTDLDPDFEWGPDFLSTGQQSTVGATTSPSGRAGAQEF
jgi:hypothetical protein